MAKVIASITTSVDVFVTGPDDRPQYGLGKRGARLHYWVMGGPWTYQGGPLRDVRPRQGVLRRARRELRLPESSAGGCTTPQAPGEALTRFPAHCSCSPTAPETATLGWR